MDKKTRLDLLKIFLPSDFYDALRYFIYYNMAYHECQDDNHRRV